MPRHGNSVLPLRMFEYVVPAAASVDPAFGLQAPDYPSGAGFRRGHVFVAQFGAQNIGHLVPSSQVPQRAVGLSRPHPHGATPRGQRSFREQAIPKGRQRAQNRPQHAVLGDSASWGDFAHPTTLTTYTVTGLPFSGTTTLVLWPFISAMNLSALGSMMGNVP